MLFNKIFGAILAVLLGIMGIKEISSIAFGKGHHKHGHADERPINEILAEKFPGYVIPVAEAGASQEEEDVFDLGALLALADASAGERSFRSKCSSCHTIDAGGATLTGPNLNTIVGRGITSYEGFGFSSGMQAYAAENGNWGYEQLNEFLANPRGTVSGTSMAFAGLRRDNERVNVMAYLASVNAAAPAFPAPLPAAEEMNEELSEDAALNAEGGTGIALPSGLIETANGVVDGVQETAAEAGEAGQGLVDAAINEANAQADTLTDAVDGATDAANAQLDGLIQQGQDEAQQVIEAGEEAAGEALENLPSPN